MLCAQTLRQILVVTSLTFCCISDGYIFGQMSGMIDALHNSDGAIRLSNDDISWIGSIVNIICLCGFGVMTVLTEILGRRISMTILTCPVILSWIMVYFAEDKTTLFISRIIVGISFGAVLLLTFTCIGEYVPPNTRPLCLSISSFGTNAGTMIGHIFSTFLHWRNVAIIGIIPSTLSAILPLFWVESPSWLAKKGRLKECERAFKLLHIPSDVSNKELLSLLANQRDKVYTKDKVNSLVLLVTNFVEVSKTKYFWKLFQLLFVIIIYRVAAGRVLFSTFAITILLDITGSSDILVFILFVDGFMMIGTAISCILVSRFNMRSLLLKSGILANVIQLLFAMSLFVWEERYDYVAWIKVSLLAFYVIIINVGPYAVIETLITELFPLDVKGSLMFILGIINGMLQFLCIKFASSMFATIGYCGVFFMNTLLVFVCLMYLYVYLPETKGRTLQEIELYFKYNTFDINVVSYQQEEELFDVNNKDKTEIDTN